MIVKEENRMIFSKIEIEELGNLNDKVSGMFDILLDGMENGNIEILKNCERIEAEIDEIVKSMRLNHLKRLQKGESMPLSGVIFSDIVLHFERTRDLLYDISRNLLEIGVN